MLLVIRHELGADTLAAFLRALALLEDRRRLQELAKRLAACQAGLAATIAQHPDPDPGD